MRKAFHFFIVLFTLAGLQGCLGIMDKPKEQKEEPVPLKLSADSGYLYKAQVMQFIAANDIADTLATWWKQWQPTDTIGKFYRTDSGHILCILTTDEALGGGVEVNKLIEIDKKGLLKNVEELRSEYCDLNRRTDVLQRRGGYFFTRNCGHGPSFASSSFRLFKTLATRAVAGELMESYYEGAPYCKDVSSTWWIKNDTCYINYTAVISSPTDSGCVVQGRQNVLARYYASPQGWRTSDSSKLHLLKIEPFAKP